MAHLKRLGSNLSHHELPYGMMPMKIATNSFPVGILAAVALMLTAACTDDATTQPDDNSTAFVATDADFAGFRTWTQTTQPLSGPDPGGLLGGAHGADDPTKTRLVYINSATAAQGADGHYPNGTILVKDLLDSNGTSIMTVAMAKRGLTFNSAHRGWEWFLLDPANGSVMHRADTLMGGMCNGCHSGAAARDYVFTK